MKITNYTMVSHADKDRFVELVAMSIDSGWQPLGGVAAASEQGSGVMFYQAMVKYEQASGLLIREDTLLELQEKMAAKLDRMRETETATNGGKRKKEGK